MDSSQPQHNPPQRSETTDALPDAVQRAIPRTRYAFVLAIVSSYVAAVVLLVIGTIETFSIIPELLRFDGHTDMETTKLHFIETLDTFLVATIFYVIASGFYQLFGQPVATMPNWLRVASVDDLEHKLIGVLITVLGVLGLSRVAAWDGQSNLLPFGVTVALLIAALGFFATRTKH